jgi:hypothetical protein
VSRTRLLLVFVLPLGLSIPALARAAPADAVLPPRALGMGGALRGSAMGDAGPMLNPSGMSLARSNVLEGAYGYMRPDASHVGHVSIVDSTSAWNLAGGIYYTYAVASADEAPGSRRHEGGLALSFPFGDKVAIGATVRYLRARFEARDLEVSTPVEARRGLTADAGLTIRPLPSISLGLVGYGLRDLQTIEAPLAMGWGAAFVPRPELIIAFDGVVDFTTYDEARGNALSLMGGAEYAFLNLVAVRGGGGYDGQRRRGHGSLGVSLLGDVGAIDLGVRQELSGDGPRGTFIGVAGRLYLPAQ